MQGASDENMRKSVIVWEPLWFVAAFLPMVASQVLRLQAGDPATWLLCDYAGRIGSLIVLATIPAANAIAFRHEELRITGEEVIAWVLTILLVFFAFSRMTWQMAPALPNLRLGAYPELHGWLYGLDITFGLALVALHEEIVFRRCARHILRGLGDGFGMVLVTALLFGAYHWWTGIPNIACAMVFGVAAMLFYRRAGTIWPIVALHYIVDFIAFV